MSQTFRLFICADLPPPPEPPPTEGSQVDLAAMSKARTQPPSREWRADQRTQSQWSTEGLKTYYTLTNRVSHPSCNYCHSRNEWLQDAR